MFETAIEALKIERAGYEQKIQQIDSALSVLNGGVERKPGNTKNSILIVLESAPPEGYTSKEISQKLFENNGIRVSPGAIYAAIRNMKGVNIVEGIYNVPGEMRQKTYRIQNA